MASSAPPVHRAGRPEWPSQRVMVGAAALALFVAVGPSIAAPFVGDDYEELLSAHVGGSSATQVLHAGRNNRPLHRWLLDAQYHVGGGSPVAFHVTSLFLHIVAAVLVTSVARAALTAPARRGASTAPITLPAFAGAVFLLMPNHVEPLVWAAAQADLTMTCLFLGALWIWLAVDPTRHPVARPAATAVVFVAALAAKETAIVLPVVILSAEWLLCSSGVPWRRRIVPGVVAAAPLGVVAVGYLAARRIAFGSITPNGLMEDLGGGSVTAALRHGGSAIVRSWLPPMPPLLWAATAATAVVLALAAAMRSRRTDGGGRVATRHRPRPTAPVAWLLLSSIVTVVPGAGLGISATTNGGERLAYLPSAFVAVAIAWLVMTVAARLRPRSRTVLVAAPITVAVVAFAVGTARWSRSADLAGRSVAQLSVLPVDRPAYLLNAPDALAGTVVLRNGSAPALVLEHGWRQPPALDEIATVDLASPNDHVEVTLGPEPHTYRVHLTERGSSFQLLATGRDGWTVAGVTVTKLDRRTVLVRWDPEIATGSFWYSSDGRLRPAPR